MPTAAVLEQLASARRIADYADRLGIMGLSTASRDACDHLGAVLADAILQAGMNYRTVVRIRVERIRSQFPEAATLSGLSVIIDSRGAADFLMWNHATKVARFVSLAQILEKQTIETTVELKQWLYRDDARERLLRLHGIGPKTYDYLCCLVGIDCIAVDRHIRTFALEAGVTVSDYDGLKLAVSYAADLLGLPRRDFDAWIWRIVSNRAACGQQLSLI